MKPIVKYERKPTPAEMRRMASPDEESLALSKDASEEYFEVMKEAVATSGLRPDPVAAIMAAATMINKAIAYIHGVGGKGEFFRRRAIAQIRDGD